jgi:hypothetical protein
MTTTVEERVSSFDAEDPYRCRKKAYKWYKHYLKPTKESMCRIVDYANDELTQEDVDLLPWNLEETEVITKEMKSLQKEKEKEKKEKKKDRKEKEHEIEEDTVFPELIGSYSYKCPTLLKGEMSDSFTSLDLDFSQNSSSDSLDASSSSWDQDHTQEHHVSAEQLRTIEVEAEYEHELKREERRQKRLARKKSIPKVDVQEKISSRGSLDASSSSRDQDHTQEHPVSTEQLQTIEIEKEHEHKREEHRLKIEEAKKSMLWHVQEKRSSNGNVEANKSMPEVDVPEMDVQEKSSSSGSLDASSSSRDQDHTQEHPVSAEQLRAIEIEKEHNRKREERRLRREEAKKSEPEVDVSEADVQDKSMPEDTKELTPSEIEEANRNDRRERAFLWYTRMGNLIRSEFKRKIASQKVDITPEDVDLLAWHENGTILVNYTAMNEKIMTRMMKQPVTYL